MTQNEMILRYLKGIGPITPVEALQEFGCFRLGARIHQLRQRGYTISTEMVSKKNVFGKWTRFARYSIVEGGS